MRRPLTIVSQVVTTGIIKWSVVKVSGNSAIEFGVVQKKDKEKDDALHRNGVSVAVFWLNFVILDLGILAVEFGFWKLKNENW